MTNEKHICQSCAMPMTEADFGRNADGTPNSEYCKYCMKDGELGDCTLEQMIDICSDIDVRDGRAADKEAAASMYRALLPMLKRWGGTGAMEYETVMLDEMIIEGVSCTTSNTAPDMQAKIGGLWQKLYGENIPDKLTNKTNPFVYGVYSNYSSDFTGEYTFTAGCPVTCAQDMEGISSVVIPSGKYAKFIVHGDMVKDVAAFWCRLWVMNLNRAYTADFEEYVGEHDFNIYISLAD